MLVLRLILHFRRKRRAHEGPLEYWTRRRGSQGATAEHALVSAALRRSAGSGRRRGGGMARDSASNAILVPLPVRPGGA